MTKPFLRLATGAAAMLYTTLALAQLPGQFNAMPPPADAQSLLNSQAAPPAPVCPKLCPADNSPCDPIYMKETDGRCDGINFGLSR